MATVESRQATSEQRNRRQNGRESALISMSRLPELQLLVVVEKRSSERDCCRFQCRLSGIACQCPQTLCSASPRAADYEPTLR